MVKFRGLSDRDKQCILDVLGVCDCCFGHYRCFPCYSILVLFRLPFPGGLVWWSGLGWLVAGCGLRLVWFWGGPWFPGSAPVPHPN